MNNFINDLISRHVESSNIVMPRLKGRFESADTSANTSFTDITFPDDKNPLTQKSLAQKTPSITTQNTNEIIEQGKADHLENFQHSSAKNVMAGDDNRITKNENNFKDPGDAQFDIPDLQGNNLNRALNNFPQQSPAQAMTENVVPQDLQKQIIVPVNINYTEPHEKKIIEKKNVIENEHGSEPEASPDSPLKNTKSFAEKTEVIRSYVKPSGFFEEPQGILNTFRQNENLLAGLSYTSATPIIKVNIGQIVVRAVTQPATAYKKPVHVTKPAVSLEEYLKKRGKD